LNRTGVVRLKIEKKRLNDRNLLDFSHFTNQEKLAQPEDQILAAKFFQNPRFQDGHYL